MESLQLSFDIDHKSFAEMDRFFMVSGEILQHLKPMFEKFVPTIRKEVKDQFKAEGNPKWKALKASYLASQTKMQSKFPMSILKLSGKMWRAATSSTARGNITSVTNDGVTYGIKLSVIPYAQLHNLGGKVSGRGKGYHMPKREYLKLTKDGVRRIVQKAHRFIRSEMRTGNVKFE